MVFVSLTLEQGIQITVSVWNRGIFYVQFGSGNNTLEQSIFLLLLVWNRVPILAILSETGSHVFFCL